MLLEPISFDLVDFIHDDFSQVFFDAAGQSIQIRQGRYVVNGHTFPHECLVLDENDVVIDGFCGSPLPWLHWKRRTFIDHLIESRRMIKPDWYDDMFAEGWNEEFVDIHHWKT
jgi:hypothetical protein